MEDFYKWWDENHKTYWVQEAAKKAWMQATRQTLDLEEQLIESRIRIDDLERWIAGIADDHPQIPDWIQQSARSLLAQGVSDNNL